MATEEMFTSLPTVSSATMSDIICAVQGYTSPSNLGLSVQETLQQVYTLFQSNIILFNSGNPNGVVAGSTYQFCWDTLDKTLWLCVTSGTTSTAVWIRADINDGYATTVTAAGTTTLTIISPYWQFFTGSTTQTVVMPVESTLAPGVTWSIVNNSSGAVTVQSSGLNTIVTIPANSVSLVTCILASGTSAASWNATTTSTGVGVTSITGTAHQVIASASTGAVTLSTPQNIDTNSNVTFNSLVLTTPLNSSYGGTGANNGGNILGYQGAINFIGAYTLQVTLTGATSIQFPTGGILLNSNLTSADFYVGNGSNIATGVPMSGDATLANTGAVTVSNIGGKSISLANSFTTSGNFTVTQTYTGNTNVTFPTSGTLATSSAVTTWTPTITFDTPGDLSVVYGLQSAYYSRVGNIIQVTYQIQFTPTFTTSSGNLRVLGLPVTVDANAGAFGSCLIQAPTFPIGCTSVFTQAFNNGTYFVVGANGSGVAAAYFTATQITSGANVNLIGSFTYLA